MELVPGLLPPGAREVLAAYTGSLAAAQAPPTFEAMTALIPIFVALVGLVAYAIASNPKAQRVGEILFFNGSLVALFVLARHVLRLP